jgi:hypothetical protein
MNDDDRLPADEKDHRPDPTTDRTATDRSRFPAYALQPGRWDLADLRIRRPSRPPR